MSRARDMLEALASERPPAECCRELDAELSNVASVGDLRELLAASSILLRAGAQAGDWQAADLGRGIGALENLRGPEQVSYVIALGTGGRDVLGRWFREGALERLRRCLLLDCDSAMVRGLPAAVPQIAIDVLGAGDGGLPVSHCELLRNAYRTAAGNGAPPPALAEALVAAQADRYTLHLVVDLEDPWIAAVPDLAMDLRSLLGAGRSRLVLHLVTRPTPRLRGGFAPILEDIERSRPVDDVFFVSGMEGQLADRVGDLVRLADEAPEILAGALERRRPGVFSSYGVTAVVLHEDDSPDVRLRTIDEAFAAAAPSWLPGARPLPEIVNERIYLIHDPAAPPPDEAWRLCPELVSLPVPGATLKLCRIQRGLSLRELRLV